MAIEDDSEWENALWIYKCLGTSGHFRCNFFLVYVLVRTVNDIQPGLSQLFAISSWKFGYRQIKHIS